MGGWGLGTGPREAQLARIVVTRPAGREAELLDRLRRLGHESLHVPLVAVEPLGDELVDVSGYDWVVLTSVVGAQELKRRMRGVPQRVAAIGHATAEAFGGADVIATTSTQEGLLAVLPSPQGESCSPAPRGHAVSFRRPSAPTWSSSTGRSSSHRATGPTATSSC